MVRYVWGYLASFRPAGATCIGEKPQAAMPTLSASTQTCGHQNREGAERREGWVLMHQKCAVSGERQICLEILENRATGSSSGNSPMGRFPHLCLIITTTTSQQGTYVHQPGSQGIVTTQGTHQGKKQTRSLPRGAPTPGKERGEHISRDCVSRFIHANLCMLQTRSVMKVHPLCPGCR